MSKVMISLKTNVSALNVQKQSAKSSSALETAIRRLSSGMRINSASDNAAGQAISNRLTSQQNGLEQAQRNAGDALSMIDTAESALNEVNNRLQRIRELTVQGLNGTYSQTDSDAIQAEINLNLKAIDEINRTSQFNGISLLNGSAGKVGFQVGANDNQKIDLNLSAPGMSVAEIGLKDLVISGISNNVVDTNGYTSTAYNISLNSSSVTVSYTAAGITSPQLVRSTANSQYYIQGTDTNGNAVFLPASVSADWYTQTGTGTVSVSASSATKLYSDVSQIPARAITPLTMVDTTGTTLSGTTLTHANGQYYIEQDDFYYPATLSFGTSGAVTATMTSTSGLLDTDFATPPAQVTTTPAIDTSTTATTFTDANGSTVSGRLVKSGSQYMMEMSDGSGSFRYYPATVNATTDGTTTALHVIATSSTSQNGFTAVTSVSGRSHVTLDPAKVDVTYTDADGNTFNDVLRLDSDGKYYMDLPASTTYGAKTATLALQNDLTNTFYLKTLNGVGAVQIYYRTALGSSTDASTNFTTLSVWETGAEIRLRHPENPLAAIDNAISQVDSRRTELGGVANRLTSVKNAQGNAAATTAATRSRIEDADYAAEVSAMTRAQILQQSSMQVLAKANMTPEIVLSLLKGG
ncbi:TPA: flagellin [Kluyvera intermedia]|uniref:Flagellin n=2 Tax=Enterobacteriaceae TaxID=543 RepID=A0A9P3T789_KLUIN|nr:flagellin [Phytobacter ursingii]MDU6686408.1 flagellin [Enterobacteriaceae bacterium]HAT2204309.1 flagellin [Kluyvera intermedia]HAT2517249.1 flagellin [Kluyvera intermedia]HAT2605250.1 flagellin [Kluyvera intermedia]HAT2679632.1 flagellin [Kluyvera intermedia]